MVSFAFAWLLVENRTICIDAPKRLGSVASLPQLDPGACFLLRGVPNDAVDTRCPFAIIARHSLHGKRFAAERVGQ